MKHHPSAPSSRHVGKLSRRRFIQSTAAVGSQMLMPKASRADGSNLEAYTSATSVPIGGTLVIYARDPQATGGATTDYPLTIVRMGDPDVAMLSTSVTLGNQVVPFDASSNGCRWAPSWQISIPNTWPSGLYWASISAGPNACNVPFVVRAVRSTPGVKVLVQIPVTTVHAYNNYGGKSLYDYNSTGGRASQVSFDRPFSEPFNSSFDGWEASFVRWLAKNGVVADFCTSVDLHADSGLLAPYQLVLSAGHDEYWTQAMRDHLDAHVAGGGNAAIFGGNTCWWQARFEDGGGVAHRTLVCYKSASDDPIADPKLKTVNWHDLVPPNPENTTTGLSFFKGAGWSNPLPRPDTPFVVQRPEHWVFAGTGLTQGASFAGSFVGYETDAADFVTGADGRFYPTGLDGSPASLRILAQADATQWDADAHELGLPGELSGHAAIGIFSRGGASGTVFNGGVTDWAYGLNAELAGQPPTPISAITRNVIQRLSSRWAESADVRQFHAANAGRPDNCYYTTGTQGPAGMGLDGIAFRAYLAPASGTVPIYRYRARLAGPTGQRYRYSSNSRLDPLGLLWILESAPAFHAYRASRSDVVPVHEFYALDGLLFSFRYATGAAPAGWLSSGVAFYAPGY